MARFWDTSLAVTLTRAREHVPGVALWERAHKRHVSETNDAKDERKVIYVGLRTIHGKKGGRTRALAWRGPIELEQYPVYATRPV